MTPRHLLVIDAMEGMEAFGGDLDAFGQKTTRRGRVAKLMRLAGTKCHLVLVIEEPKDDVRMAEQFVADVVLRLRATEDHGYSRRTIEIEKTRGQSHVRGRHPYVIRDGRGSTTGEQVNSDDPRVPASGTPQSYIDVFPSLDSISRSIMENRAPGRDQPSGRRAGFGIQELDEMLAIEQPDQRTSLAHGQDRQGLPCGTVSALIGDANTQKSFLGYAFLGHVFHELVWSLVSGGRSLGRGSFQRSRWSEPNCGIESSRQREHYVRHLCACRDSESRKTSIEPQWLSEDVRKWAHRIEHAGRHLAGAAVLVTTKDESHRSLVERFHNQLREQTTKRAQSLTSNAATQVDKLWADDGAFSHALTGYLESRTICRRLEIHDTPSAVLYHVIRRAFEAAQQIVMHDFADSCRGLALNSESADRAEEGWRIRFVLDDFDSVMRTYSRVHDDRLFLPFLLLNLRREGISTLIIETQSGTPGTPPMILGEDATSDLRALSDHRIYTWHVPNFFGDHRIAIAAIPPMVRQDRKSPVLVRELEWYEPNSKLPPRVNPRFELYAGLDTNRPTLVPLRVHLYAETSAWQEYISRLDDLWKRLFDPPELDRESRDAHVRSTLNERDGTVVVGEKAENYELLHEVCGLHVNTNLNYSLILQVDEFWRHSNVFRPQFDYLSRPVENSTDEADREGVPTRVVRRDWFVDLGYGMRSTSGLSSIDRIPFTWDFGFLACKDKLWEDALRAGSESESKRKRRSEVWKPARETWERLKVGRTCTWRAVLQAAKTVAEWESAHQSRPVPAFDVAMVAPETFSCLVLEIWFSEIFASKRPEANPIARQLSRLMAYRRSEESVDDSLTLSTLVDNCWIELYCAWLLLAESLDLGAFGARKEGFGFGYGRAPSPNAVVTRHWYKSAAMIDPSADGSVRFCRLPGAFSVRGDWFLSTVRGSRSERLSDRALDLLSSPEANVDRLMRGLGLPTRKLDFDERNLSTDLRGLHYGSDPSTLTLTYEDVRRLGKHKKWKRFNWLWRGNLKCYDIVTPVWERWLYRILRRWKRTRESLPAIG